jgi:hypothetical protein
MRSLFFPFLLLIGLTQACSAQTLFFPEDPEELKQYSRDRLLRISYEALSRVTNERTYHRGTGFLISKGGYAITARHVLEAALDYEQHDIYNFKIEYAEGGHYGTGVLDTDVTRQSETADITTFRISKQTGQPFGHYFCVEKTNTISSAKKADLITLQFYNRVPSSWEITNKQITVEQQHGPPGLFDYWAFSEPFENSMSGGAVLLKGRVIAVVSNSLNREEKPNPGSNYANLLRYAGDTGWRDRADDCQDTIPEPQSFVPFRGLESFMSGTCEGTLAFIKNTKQYWALPTRGNYEIRTRDLARCDPSACEGACTPSSKTIRMVVNHSIASKQASCKNGASLATGVQTFYGAQVIPLFNPQTQDTQTYQAWLFRSRQLYRRSANGSFGALTQGEKRVSFPMPPSKYNEITMQEVRSRSYRPPHCSGMSSAQCEDFTGIDYFDSQTNRLLQWHGYVRQTSDPISTLGVGLTRYAWTVPQNWLPLATQVKNYILPYQATPKPRSENPVDFAFCVDSSWDGFLVRAFSPERNIQSHEFHVYLTK